MSLAARIEAALVQEIPSVKVEVKEHEIFINLRGALREDKELMERVTRLARNIAGLELKVHCHMRP
jgi:hypothetical protein